jgi:glutamate N-acetyltransferase/amino-acid N-acetyltransferase
MSIANSPLVKTALFAEDPNWGRILSAIGNIDTKVKDLSKVEIYIGNFLVFKNNKVSNKYKENKVKKYLKNKNIEINVNYNTGKYKATVWTTDLSYEYIKINAEYRT